MPSRTDPLKTCLHLRSKDMFYKVADEEADRHERDCERAYGKCDTAMFWCDCTQTGRGPDDRPANRAECRPGRKCFVSIHSLA